jgi:hypothetical protein
LIMNVQECGPIMSFRMLSEKPEKSVKGNFANLDVPKDYFAI